MSGEEKGEMNMQGINKCVKIGAIIISLSIIMLIACACQQTPERNAVVYGGGLEEKLKGSPAPFCAYEAPANWHETLDLEGSDINIEIDASISVPDVTAFPVYKVKKTEFDDSRIRPLVNFFTKGKDVLKDTEPTKAELEEQLILAKKNNDEETIADLESRIANAPVTVEPEVITDWNAKNLLSGNFLEENGEYAGINVSPDMFEYTKSGFSLIERMRILDINAFGEPAISKEDVIAAAQNLLRELGIEGMAVGSLEKELRYSSVDDAFSKKEPVSKGYLINFARNIDGTSGILNDHGVIFGITDDFAYRAPLYPEQIQVCVNEAGKVEMFTWWYPLEVKEKVTENAPLMSFEEVKQRIRDMLTFINSSYSVPTKVIRIELNMAIVDVKDHPGEAMYVPTWFIYYRETFNDPETGEEEYQELRLGLNAVDGGRVLEMPVHTSEEMQQAIDEQNKNQ